MSVYITQVGLFFFFLGVGHGGTGKDQEVNVIGMYDEKSSKHQ